MKDRLVRLVSISVFVLLLVGAGLTLNNAGEGDSVDTSGALVTPLSFIDDNTGLRFNYSAPFSSQSLTPEDINDQFIGRLVSNVPAMIVSIRYEDGLRSVATLANTDPLALVTGNAIKALPSRYTNFVQNSDEPMTISEKLARQLIFEYVGQNGEPITQQLLIIQSDEDTVIYIAAQSASSDYENSRVLFDDINRSIVF